MKLKKSSVKLPAAAQVYERAKGECEVDLNNFTAAMTTETLVMKSFVLFGVNVFSYFIKMDALNRTNFEAARGFVLYAFFFFLLLFFDDFQRNSLLMGNVLT